MGDLLEYNRADPLLSKQTISEFVAEDLIPTSRMNYILIVILVLVFVGGIFQFPIGSFLSGNLEGLKVTAGYPLYFLEIEVMNPTTNPFKFIPLVIDLIIYIIISYALDILFLAITRIFHSKVKVENKGMSSLFGRNIKSRIIEVD